MLSVLGTGGMAEVYRARDTRLGREVALKVVNESLAANPDLVRRFEQEARLAGSLNHPNLLAVYDFGQHEGAPYFVTELLQGQTLRARLSHAPIPLHTALDWAAQMARGLAAAHARGIVHRDVKPDNVFITSDGQLKLLDFGIAKLAEGVLDRGPRNWMDATETPTGGSTRTGSVLGTPGYMSPEQLRGEPLDARTDIFSCGATLYEMLSGRRAFPGATVVDSGYAILHHELEPLPLGVPLPLGRIVLRCLEKDPGHRLQSAADLAYALEAIGAETASGVPRLDVGAPHRRARWRLGAGAALLLVLAAVAILSPRRAPIARVPSFEEVTLRWGAVTGARFLPDGRIAFTAGFEGNPEQLFVRPEGSVLPQALGLDDARLVAAIGSAELGVLVRPRYSMLLTSRGTLARIPSVGGTPRELVENVEYADWSSRGDLAVVRVTSGARVLESPPGHELFRTTGAISHPRFSSTAEQIAFLHHPVYGLDRGEVMVVTRSGKARTVSMQWPTIDGLAWTPDDREIWFTAGTGSLNELHAVSPAGEARDVYASAGYIELQDIRSNGDVLLNSHIEREEAVSVDARGRETLLTWSNFTAPVTAVSDDGKALFGAYEPPGSRGSPRLLAILKSVDGSQSQVLGTGWPLDLSLDGRWALLEGDDGRDLAIVPAGAGHARSVDLHGLSVHAARWMPDQRTILVAGRRPDESESRLYQLTAEGQLSGPIGEARLGGRRVLHVSPDGKWAAGSSPDYRLLLVSLPEGRVVNLPASLQGTLPRGWSSTGDLWVSEGGDRVPARMRLIRVSIPSGSVREERTVSPPEPAGTMNMTHVVISPDGRNVVFMFHRFLGSLVIARGLWTPGR